MLLKWVRGKRVRSASASPAQPRRPAPPGKGQELERTPAPEPRESAVGPQQPPTPSMPLHLAVATAKKTRAAAEQRVLAGAQCYCKSMALVSYTTLAALFALSTPCAANRPLEDAIAFIYSSIVQNNAT